MHPQNPENLFFITPATEERIRLLIRFIKFEKSNSQARCGNKFLKFGMLLISDTLSKFFNKFIEEGIYPSCLKIAEVIPVFKKVNRYMSTYYRPIFLLSHFGELFENLNQVY